MPDSRTPRFPIRVAARRSGVGIATLRAWEQRYGAVAPARSTGAQRLYSDADVERITLLQRLTELGHAISALAAVETEELRRLASDETGTDAAAPAVSPVEGSPAPDEVLRACVRALRAHDGAVLHELLVREVVRSTPMEAIEGLIAPFSRRIGDEWATGRVLESHERIASNAIRQVLVWMLRVLTVPPQVASADAPRTPRILIATLNGERHENGVLMAGVAAAAAGFDVVHAGADLPPSAIASAARASRASVVALSMVDASGPRVARRHLLELRASLPARSRVVIGGAAASLASDTIAEIGATQHATLGDWIEDLRRARSSRASA